MKRKLIFFTLIVLTFCLLLASCAGDKKVEKINVYEGLATVLDLNATPDYSAVKATVTYNDGTVEEAHPDKKPMQYSGGEVYWGVQHIRQIEQFYKACLGLEPLEIDGEEALKTHRLIMKMYELGGMKK